MQRFKTTDYLELWIKQSYANRVQKWKKKELENILVALLNGM